MNNLQAAVGLASLEEIADSIRQKRDMASLYRSLLSDVPGLILPHQREWAKSIYWMYAVRTDPDKAQVTRDVLTARLAREYRIQTRTFFYSPKTAFAPMGLYKTARFPVSETLERTGFYLPSGLGNTRQEFRKTARALRELLIPGVPARTNPR
jgi:perosamine synthetase